jgi:putative thioredoxin
VAAREPDIARSRFDPPVSYQVAGTCGRMDYMSSPNFSLHGAVDLGARAAAAKRQQEREAQAAEGGAPVSGGAVIDVTDETFNTEVVQRSRQVPVLVDFWAEWCGPCKQLSPILEKLAGEAAGAWVLAKIDIDANPQLAAYMQQMGVRGIPFVAAVVGGQLMPFLNGAAPEAQVRQAIDQLFAALRQEGLLPEDGAEPAAEDTPADELDPIYHEAEDALQRGDFDTAATAFSVILEKNPQDAHAKTGLALVELSRRVSGYDARTVITQAEDQPANATLQTQAADVEMVSGRIDDAFNRLVATVKRTAGDDRDIARTHLLLLFEVLPAEDPRVQKARRALQSALF